MLRLEATQQLAQLAIAKGISISTAESCTGGGLAKAFTDLAGSSAWFGYGLVTYSNEAKQQLLQVSNQSLQEEGAVSQAVVKQMVKGACQLSGSQLAVAISGVAGPGGGSPQKPVGTVWLAWGNQQQQLSHCYQFTGTRQQIREASIDAAITHLIEWLSSEL